MNQEIDRRRTFAIISHPDAGKTTLTEKFLLFGGQIQVAQGRFAKWSRSLGFLSQQQAELQRDCECRQMLGGCLPA